MRDLIARRAEGTAPWVVAAVCLVIGLAIVRPFTDVPISYDAQATVTYFDRLIRGVRLEQAMSTTPKPFLTIVEGLAYKVTGNWLLIVWLTMLAQASAAGLVTEVGRRVAGTSAGIAAGLAVAGTPLLIEDAAFGSAVAWALLFWAVAAVLLSNRRARPGLAGFALLLAALCRIETLVIVAVVALAVAWARFGPWVLPGTRPVVPGRLWLVVGLPFMALPVMLVHDWLLIGDPFYWMKVSERYSENARLVGIVLGPVERVLWFVRRYRHVLPFLILGLVGAIVLIRDRRWGLLTGLVAMGPGIAAFIVLLAFRGLYAPERYALPVDLALYFLAAVGFGRLLDLAAGRISPRRDVRGAVSGAAFAVVMIVFGVAGWGPFSQATIGRIADLRILNENAARVEVLLAETIDQRAGATVSLAVPTAVRPRLTMDLGLPLGSVASLSLAWLDAATAPLQAGQLIYHDRRGDIPGGQFTPIERNGPVVIGRFTLEPLLIDAGRGVWVYEVAATP